MSYSISTIIQPYADKNGLSKVIIQVIYDRMKVYAPTEIKVKAAEFEKGTIIGHKEKKRYNVVISEQRHQIERRLLDRLRVDNRITKHDLDMIAKGTEKKNTDLVSDYIKLLIDQQKGKLSPGRLRHYIVIGNKLNDYSPKLTFGSISVNWLNDFEAWLRSKKLDSNTVLSNMSIVISILNKASVAGLIEDKNYKRYKRPAYNQKLVEYLSESELDKIKSFLDIIEKPGHRLAGYYFLLSSLTGYRISDARRFNYNEMVKDGQIVLRAGKNGKIVSIPVYPKLKIVLDFIKDNPLTITDQRINICLKEIANYCGIGKDLHYHISRHSFAMWLISKGFSIDEVATLLGDSPEIARVYAQISNTHLSQKVMERL